MSGDNVLPPITRIASNTGAPRFAALPAWCRDWVGISYADGANGPDAYDCYHYMAAIQRTVYRLTPPVFPGAFPELPGESRRDDARRVAEAIDLRKTVEWLPIDAPEPGAAVLLRWPVKACHCGVVVTAEPPIMLHIHRGVEAHPARLDQPPWSRRVVGFYRYVG